MRLCTTYRSVCLGVALGMLALTALAVAQQAPSASEAQSTVPQTQQEKEKKEKKREKLEEVVVTGTNIKENISDISVKLALPLSVITADQIALQGPQDLTATLRDDPAFTGGTSNGGSGGYFAGADTTLDLFGLGDQYTLVLVDGQRFNAIYPANIANIPASAISRIDVLKDGGSSIYGSDAVAGVVNIILNKNFQGMEVTASYGQRVFWLNNGTDLTVDTKFGTTSERFRIVGNLEFRKRGETKQTDTELGRTGSIDERVIYSNPANIILPNGEDVILNYHVFKPGSYSLNPADYIPYNFTDYNQTIGQVQRQTLTDRQPQQDVSGFLSTEYDLNDNAMLFSEIYYSYFRAFEQDKDWGVDGYGDPHLDFGPIPASNYWNPFGVTLPSVFYGLPELGGVTFNSTINTARLIGGARGTLGDLNWEVSATDFRNDELDQWGNFYSDSALYAAIHRPGPTAINLFCYDCNTPTQLAGIDVSQELETISQQSVFDAKLSGPLVKRDNYDLAFAAGAETRQEKWNFEVDPLTATGDIYYNQFSPAFEERRDSAVYAEVGFHLGEGAQIPGIHNLTLNLSGRHDWIESVGGTTNPHIVASWQPISSDFMLRGSYGTSFRAPPVNLLTATRTVVNDYLIYPNLGNIQLPTDVIEGGNPNLRPETARTFNLGIVIAPSIFPGSSLTVDRVQIWQRNVVLIPNPQDIIDGTFPGTVNYSGARPLIDATATNAAGRDIQVYDAALNLRYATARFGTFGLKYRGVLLTEFDVNNGSGYQNQLGQFQSYVYNVGQPGALGSLPRLRQNGGPNWTSPDGSLTAQVTANFVDHYRDALGTSSTPPFYTRWVSQFLTWDFNLSADLSHQIPGLTANVGVLNIFNEQPPYVEGFFTTYLLYDPGLSNSLGRYAFVTLKYRF
jgi:iron complex outermembrane recepter protein